jgi:predicted RNase H-like HicB family nuclease
MLVLGEKTMMKLLVTLFQDEDGVFVAECPAIPGCVSQGETEEDALHNVREAIRECLEVRAELGMPLTVTTREVEVPV